MNCSSEVRFAGNPPALDPRDPLNAEAVPKDVSKPTVIPSTPVVRKIQQNFVASDLLQGAVRLTAGIHDVSREIELRSAIESRAKDFTQITRPQVTKIMKQGHPGTAKSESFNQMNLGVLDLLIVIDNSRSMAEEQQNLAARLDPLMQFVNESDWRINVVTTDPKDGCSRAVIRRGDPNAEANFRNAIMAGTAGDGNEQGIRMAVEGLSCPQANWLRPNSSIAVLIVSDEDNCSNRGSGCSAPYNSPNYLLDHISQKLGRTPGKNARIYGVIWQPNTSCRDGYSVGTQYAELISRTGGKSGSICDPDYAPTLRSISSDVATILNSDFELASLPDMGSVRVSVNGAQQASGYSVNGRTLHFDPKPSYGAMIQVAYTAGATPMFARFPVGQVPAAGTMVVVSNGQVLNPSLYTFDFQTQELVFLNPPPADADIKLEFRADSPLVSRFPLEGDVIASSVRVKVNGQNVSGFLVGADHSVSLATPPADGALISVIYQAKGAPVLNYALGIQENMVKDLKVSDAETGDPVNAVLDQGSIVVSPAEHRDGRRLIVSYQDADAGHMLANLPAHWISDSLKISPEQGTCGYSVEGQELELKCDTPAGTAIDVSWQFRTPVRQIFALDGVGDPEAGLWTVLVDGQPIKAFVRDGWSVTLTEPLEAEAIVTLICEAPR